MAAPIRATGGPPAPRRRGPQRPLLPFAREEDDARAWPPVAVVAGEQGGARERRREKFEICRQVGARRQSRFSRRSYFFAAARRGKRRRVFPPPLLRCPRPRAPPLATTERSRARGAPEGAPRRPGVISDGPRAGPTRGRFTPALKNKRTRKIFRSPENRPRPKTRPGPDRAWHLEKLRDLAKKGPKRLPKRLPESNPPWSISAPVVCYG